MTPFRRADEILADMQAEKAARIDALHAEARSRRVKDTLLSYVNGTR